MTTILEDIIGYKFGNAELLQTALSHPSASRYNGKKHYQRMEFLGDAVLGMVIAGFLYKRFPTEAEGELARRHAALVCGVSVVKVAREIRLGEFLILSDAETANGGRDNDTNLEDACEALIGALYLDGGVNAASNFILKYWTELSDKIIDPPKDSKTALQEWAQARKKPLPEYTTIKTEGPSHAPTFTIEVKVEGLPALNACGSSKKAAMQDAATELLKFIEKDVHE